MTRRKSRESAFLLVFAMNISGLDAGETLSAAADSGEPEVDDFAVALMKAVCDNRQQIENMISPHLKGWKLGRISKISLAALQISCAQLLCFDDISCGVVVNEAVELSRKYGADDDYAFVNGVLGSIIRLSGPGGLPTEAG